MPIMSNQNSNVYQDGSKTLILFLTCRYLVATFVDISLCYLDIEKKNDILTLIFGMLIWTSNMLIFVMTYTDIIHNIVKQMASHKKPIINID